MMVLISDADRHTDKEPLNEYINKKREMFLVQVTGSHYLHWYYTVFT
jgi:hypothetical protein